MEKILKTIFKTNDGEKIIFFATSVGSNDMLEFIRGNKSLKDTCVLNPYPEATIQSTEEINEDEKNKYINDNNRILFGVDLLSTK